MKILKTIRFLRLFSLVGVLSFIYYCIPTSIAAVEGQIYIELSPPATAGWSNNNSRRSLTFYTNDYAYGGYVAWGLSQKSSECDYSTNSHYLQPGDFGYITEVEYLEGYNNFCTYGENEFGSWSSTFELWIDLFPPIATDDFGPRNNTWQKVDQAINISVSDYNGGLAVSNVRGLDYATSSNEGCLPRDFNSYDNFIIAGLAQGLTSGMSLEETTQGGSFSISQEGVTYFCYTPMDHAGNYGETTTRTVKIDKTPPVVTDNYGANDAVTQTETQTVTISAEDSLSGLDKIIYCTDKTNTCPIDEENGLSTPEAELTVSFLTEGSTYLRYRALDVAGNLSPVVSRLVVVDFPDLVVQQSFPRSSVALGYRSSVSISNSKVTNIIGSGNKITPVIIAKLRELMVIIQKLQKLLGQERL